MSQPAISIEGVSKRYVIEHESRHDNLRDTLHHVARKFWRRARWGTGFEREEFWALKDISFEVQPGEVVGIIGRNGAGKSTLLKVLSRITEPTSGKITLNGRVASLLEVGTGFHPDLTGRENIFLNGAILGMTRVEIRQKFDEIVAFAEIERFLDTPVKRYSSGMYVRLAFAVAAHLEPEILIVDEVLAVGDSHFQRKCLGKMKDVSRNQGRTVLFVSHNMAAVQELTSRCILLQGGQLEHQAETAEVLKRYSGGGEPTHTSSGRHSAVRRVCIINEEGRELPPLVNNQSLRIKVVVELTSSASTSLELRLNDMNGTNLAFCNPGHFFDWYLESPGVYECVFDLGLPVLATGSYGLDVCTHLKGSGPDHYVANALIIEADCRACFPSRWNLQQNYRLGHFVISHQPPVARPI